MGSSTKRKQKSAAYRYSYSRLALNYYMCYESMCENHKLPAEAGNRMEEFNGLLRGFLEGNFELEALDRLRNQVIHTMEILTAYTDCFQIYEYILNRVERRFLEKTPIGLSVNEFASMLAERLTESGDSVLVNQRIQELMGQLPIRFTKRKFYSLVLERTSVYAGAGKKDLKDLFYMLRTSAMVELPEDMESCHPELFALLDTLRTVDYHTLDRRQYENCAACIVAARERLNLETGIYILLAELINDLYVLCLTSETALKDGAEEQVFRTIVSGIQEQFATGSQEPPGEEITKLLERLEGVQEAAMERLSFEEEETEADLIKIEKLLSGSLFVSLDGGQEEEEPADSRWIEEKSREFCQELEELFSHMQKPVIRAIMAKILSFLPNVFRSEQELADYISGSLESCTDMAEREACMELLKWELVDEDALV